MKVVFSKRKTLAIEVRRDQTVVVRAPQRISQHKLNEFIVKTAEWVQKKLAHYAQMPPPTIAPVVLMSRTEKKQQLELARQIFMPLYLKCWERCKGWGFAMPQLRIRKLKSRWGSLSYRTMTVTLNSELVNVPEQCIEDVIMHEFCHLKHRNHGKRFYQLLEKMAPNWRTRKHLLRDSSFP